MPINYDTNLSAVPAYTVCIDKLPFVLLLGELLLHLLSHHPVPISLYVNAKKAISIILMCTVRICHVF